MSSQNYSIDVFHFTIPPCKEAPVKISDVALRERKPILAGLCTKALHKLEKLLEVYLCSSVTRLGVQEDPFLQLHCGQRDVKVKSPTQHLKLQFKTELLVKVCLWIVGLY